MANNEEPTISMAGINAPPLYRLVEDGDKTVIVTADTNTPMWVINGKIGGDTVEVMTTAQRMATTPELGQLIWDTDEDVLYAGDGETAGGIQVSPGTGGGDYTQGYGIEITNAATISRAAYGTIETVDVSGASPSVTMVPGHAYSISATAKAVTLNVASFNSNQFGIDDGHLEIFVANTGHVKTGANVELANALEPDAINYCTVRFVGGVAKIALEDNIGGYVVTINATSGAGSLAYGLSTATNEYISIDAALNGQTLDLAGATTYAGEKHVVGNGYAETVLSGGIVCTSKTTFSNLSMDGVINSGGTMTLGDVNIPNGATVGADVGIIFTEKVLNNGVLVHNTVLADGNGGKISGSGTIISHNARLNATNGGEISGQTITGSCGNAPDECIKLGYSTGSAGILRDCIISGYTVTGGYAGGIVNAAYGGSAYVDGCVFSGNSFANNNVNVDVGAAYNNAKVFVKDCTFDDVNAYAIRLSNGLAELSGSNTIHNLGITGGTVTISSGAVLDLTGNTNATPINPLGGVVVAGGDSTKSCTIINSAGTSVSIVGGTYTKIKNDGTTE